MNLQEKIAVMQACVDGKAIQMAKVYPPGGWEDRPYPTWNWGDFTYRVKPEPRVVYINEYKSSGGSGTWFSTPHTTQASAESSRAVNSFIKAHTVTLED